MALLTMSKQHENVDPALAEWIAAQRVFFVGTAPLAVDSHVNISPKGGDAFRLLGPLEAAYQDYTGSGAETAAHLRENGRIVIMFCAFDGPPKIARLHGRGTVVLPTDSAYADLARHFPENPGTRAIVHVAIERVSDSCGMSVPYFDFREPRELLNQWAEKQGSEKLDAYRANKNVKSIDGLPAFDPKA